jgi:heterotetrameric sarcosine oxidase delta subunit
MRIPCPWCGPRDLSEFHYGGDAETPRPAHDETAAAPWFDHVYRHDNPRGTHKEYWQHNYGCRSWLLVTRDTLSHEITAAEPMRTVAKGAGR